MTRRWVKMDSPPYSPLLALFLCRLVTSDHSSNPSRLFIINVPQVSRASHEGSCFTCRYHVSNGGEKVLGYFSIWTTHLLLQDTDSYQKVFMDCNEPTAIQLLHTLIALTLWLFSQRVSSTTRVNNRQKTSLLIIA